MRPVTYTVEATHDVHGNFIWHVGTRGSRGWSSLSRHPTWTEAQQAAMRHNARRSMSAAVRRDHVAAEAAARGLLAAALALRGEPAG